MSSKKTSDGSVRVSVDPPDDEGSPPTAEQAAAFRYLLDHEKTIRDKVLRAIFKAYPDMQACCGLDEEEARELAPDIDRPDQLKRLIGLSTVHIMHVAKNGVAYVGFEFGCTWDNEHGLGVMTHRQRVLKVGQADTSFDRWIGWPDAKSKSKKKPLTKNKR